MIRANPHSCHRTRARLVFALVAAVLFMGASHVHSQQFRASKVKNFSTVLEYFPAPHETQAMTQLEGREAQPLEDGRIEVTDVRLTRFQVNGQREMVVTAPQATADTREHIVASPGQLRVETGDAKSWIEGEGFLWQQTNTTIFISNRVHSTVQAGLLDTTSTTAGTNPVTIEIRSDHFESAMTSGIASYRDNVHVTGDVGLKAGTLTVSVSPDSRQLQSLEAERDVVVEYKGVQASGQHATYTAQTGLLEMSGEPAWHAGDRDGGGEQVSLDRSNAVLRASGNAWMKLAVHSTNATSPAFLPGLKTAHAGKSSGPETVEIRCGSYEIQTNHASFRDIVRVVERAPNEPDSTLNCARLEALFAGENELQRMTADGDVVFARADQQLSAGHAEYDAADNLLNLTRQPRWKAGSRDGGGEHIGVDLRRDEMSVRGDAVLQMPASQLGGPANAELGTHSPAATNAAGQIAAIHCDHYDINPRSALFVGNARLDHPQMQCTCETITAQFAATGDRVESVIADHNVVFDLPEKVHGTGDQAVYTYGVTNAVTNDIVRLTGQPAVMTSTNAAIRNLVIIYDRARNCVVAPGNYIVTGVMSDTTSERDNWFGPRKRRK